MQCKDIDSRPILEFIGSFNGEWCNWCFSAPYDERNVTKVFPVGTPENLVLAKMANLIRRGLVDGCDCGCRGDYVLTAKGRAEVGLMRGPEGLEPD